MLDIKFKTDAIKEASNKGYKIFLTANIDKPVNLFQAQKLVVKTGVAIQSNQLVFAIPTPENNHMGLIPGSGVELLNTSEGDEVEILMWNRNVPGQPRMIEIVPGMPLAELVVIPRFDTGEKQKASVDTDKGAVSAGAKIPAKATKAAASKVA